MKTCFYAAEQTNVFASHEYSVITPMFCRLAALCVPATSAHVELFFSRMADYETTSCQDG